MNPSSSLDHESQPSRFDFESCFHDEPPLGPLADDLTRVQTQLRNRRQVTVGVTAVAAAVLAGAVWIGFSPGQPPTLMPAGQPTPGQPTKAPGLPSEAPGLPSEGPGLPSEEPGLPSEGPSTPSAGPSEPSESPAGPSEGPAEPSQGPAEPSEGPAEPSRGPAEPSAGPGEPSESPGLPTPR